MLLSGYSWDDPPYEYRSGDYFEILKVSKGEEAYGYSSGYVTP